MLTVMENRRSFKQLKYIVYYLLELYHKKNASRNVNPQPKWWLKSVPFSRPYVGPKDLNPRDAKKALLKIIKSYLIYNGTNMIFRQVYSTALRIRELDDPKQISAKFAAMNFTGAKSSTSKSTQLKKTVIKNKSASKLTVKTVPKKKGNVVINNKKSALKSFNKNIKLINKKVRAKGEKQSVKQLTKENGTNKKASSSKRRTLLPPDKLKDKEQDNKLFIKESDLQQLIPCTSVNLFDVVKYGPVINTKEEFLQQLNLLQKDVLWKLSFLKYKKKLRNTEKDFVKSSANLQNAWPRLDNKNDSKNAASASSSKTNKSDTPVVSAAIPPQHDKTVNQQETVPVKDEIVINQTPVKLNQTQSIAPHKKPNKSLSPKSNKNSKSPPSVTPKKSTNTLKKMSPSKTSNLSKKSLSASTSAKSKKFPSTRKSSTKKSPKTKKTLPTSAQPDTFVSPKKGSPSKTLLLTNKINLKLKQLIIKQKNLSQKSRKSNKKSAKAKRSIIKIKWPVLKKSPAIKSP